MRFICTFVLCGVSFLLFGCDQSGPPVRYLLPEGFRGVFQISVDSVHGTELVRSNGIILIAVPNDGKLVLRDDTFLTRWHSETAVYPNGSLITNEAADTNIVALRGLGSDDQHHSWWLVGTDKEFRIATMITAEKPLARRLTDDDVPNYGNK